MAGGLVALLDDVAAITKAATATLDDVAAAAGKASVKATGVVVDDTAVTPRYVHGFTPDRELPIIRKIAIGSIRNKLLIILPVAMLLSQFLPGALPYLLIVGGAFLCYEGAEKVYEAIAGHHEEVVEPSERGPEFEKMMISGAIRTDLILSAEIMIISLDSVENEPFVTRLLVLIAVALTKAFDTDVNGLPLSFIISWYEQKAVAVLLSLLHLGIKDIHLGPSLPAFVTPNVLDVLVKNYNLTPIGTPEGDLKKILA